MLTNYSLYNHYWFNANDWKLFLNEHMKCFKFHTTWLQCYSHTKMIKGRVSAVRLPRMESSLCHRLVVQSGTVTSPSGTRFLRCHMWGWYSTDQQQRLKLDYIQWKASNDAEWTLLYRGKNSNIITKAHVWLSLELGQTNPVLHNHITRFG